MFGRGSMFVCLFVLAGEHAWLEGLIHRVESVCVCVCVCVC